jgi:cell division protein FtsN
MRRRSEYGGFPAALLTFSLLLLVLAVGFVVGRVVVARAYLDRAPRFDPQAAQAPEVWADVEEDRSSVPGRVYVPPPAPPESPAIEGEELLVVEPGAETESRPAETSQPLTVEARPESARGERPREGPVAPREPRQEPEPEAAPPRPLIREAEQPAQPSERVYSIQVGVFASLEGARQVVQQLARSGYQARIVPEKRGDQELYRVLTGRYRDEYAARKAVEQLRADGFEAFLIQQ